MSASASARRQLELLTAVLTASQQSAVDVVGGIVAVADSFYETGGDAAKAFARSMGAIETLVDEFNDRTRV